MTILYDGEEIDLAELTPDLAALLRGETGLPEDTSDVELL